MSLLDGGKWNRVHQIAERDARLHLPAESDKDRLGHVERHHACCCSKCNRARSSREGNTNGETRVGVSTSADCVWKEHAIQPRMNDAITRPQRNTSTIPDKIWESVMCHNVHWFRIGGGVAERLHHQVRGESQAREILKFVASHRPSGVLTADRCHFRLHVHPWEHTWQATCFCNHLLSQSVARSIRCGCCGGPERCGWRKSESLPRPTRYLLADDERDASSRLDSVKHHRALHFEGGQNFVRSMCCYFPFVWIHVDDVTHVEVVD
mmetsp:Transcript_23825/g.62630  ORF Transcript_23825/g.62630 Transcript_23825/m.62630 type:complete len:266 (-) Transcript_23825:386-1183(-)